MSRRTTSFDLSADLRQQDMETLVVERRAVRPGDLLIDATGRRYFRVDSVHPARARGYVVFFGVRLVAGGGNDRPDPAGSSAREGGNRTGRVSVARRRP
jgi:hypothetical protein